MKLDAPIGVGDPVEVRRIVLDTTGKREPPGPREVWVAATVVACQWQRTLPAIAVAYADGKREVVEAKHVRRARR